jgi:hypothetical protein
VICNVAADAIVAINGYQLHFYKGTSTRVNGVGDS